MQGCWQNFLRGVRTEFFGNKQQDGIVSASMAALLKIKLATKTRYVKEILVLGRNNSDVKKIGPIGRQWGSVIYVFDRKMNILL